MSLGKNLSYLRQQNGMTQEAFAEQMEVSRQTVSKWEADAGYPEMEKLLKICDWFHCTLDGLVREDVTAQTDRANFDSVYRKAPEGKHLFGFVKVGEKGQITISKQAREIFHIQPGDQLLLLGDEAQGLALLRREQTMHFVETILGVTEAEE